MPDCVASSGVTSLTSAAENSDAVCAPQRRIDAGHDLAGHHGFGDGRLVGHGARLGHHRTTTLLVLLQRALDHRDQAASVKGLGDGVDGPGLLHELTPDLVALGAHQHHGHVGALRMRAQLATELVAVHARHHEVEQDQIELDARLDLDQRVLAVFGGDGVVALRRQRRHDLADRGAVVDDEDARAHERRYCRRVMLDRRKKGKARTGGSGIPRRSPPCGAPSSAPGWWW